MRAILFSCVLLTGRETGTHRGTPSNRGFRWASIFLALEVVSWVVDLALNT